METPKLIQDLGMQYPTATSKQKTRYGLYLCQCGTEFKCMSKSIRYKETISCGCYRIKRATNLWKEFNHPIKHNLTNTRLYKVWSGIKTRCSNENRKDFQYYGGRNISICDEWRNDFISFYNWAMSNGYQDNLTIDRIDTNGNYEPSNCRWATMKEQSETKRNPIFRNKKGYSFVTSENRYISYITVNKKVYKKYSGTMEEAIKNRKELVCEYAKEK